MYWVLMFDTVQSTNTLPLCLIFFGVKRIVFLFRVV